MAARTKTSGMHSAGIFADMTVDGPEIGTLVVIVDRAKNLPNRKSIGKQDPYCAMRLGKEAKKTETDRRGGQTPRWDQELRFTVHDSPDYFQMKVSVFNDDKRTDLIGECWVSLADVVVAGGGQNDIWHNLSCRGKYAGEIRIEITYYDSRPKPDKQAEKPRQSASVRNDGGRSSMSGPREPSTTVRRRPLPADPTGMTLPLPAQDGTSEQSPNPARPAHSQTSYIQTQSPLQAVEYNNPSRPTPSYAQQQTSHGPRGSHGYGPLPGMTAYAPEPIVLQNGSLEIYDPADHDHQEPYLPPGRPEYMDHDRRDSNNYRQPYGEQDEGYEERQYDRHTAPPSPGGPPPPPPAHRSFRNSPNSFTGQVRPSPHIQSVPSPTRFATIQHDSHRHSMPTYGSGDRHTSSNLPKSSSQQQISTNGSYDTNRQVAPRHHSFDDHHDSSHGSMQASVEDASPSPSPAYPSTPSRDFRNSDYDNRRYAPASEPSSFNQTARAIPYTDSSVLGTSGASPLRGGYYSNNSPVSSREPSYMGSDLSARTPHTQPRWSNDAHITNGQSPYWQQDNNCGPPSRPQEEHHSACSPNRYLPPMPASLVSEVDPRIGQELSNRTYSDSQLSYHSDPRHQQQRYDEMASNRYSQPYSRHQQEAAIPFVPATSSYDDRRTKMAAGTYSPIARSRAISPDPRVPARKSVSPSPALSEPRRLSGIPFGPDAYDALNPSVAPTRPVESRHNSIDVSVDTDSKIIMHDGREVDPSDHLPQESWAPEPAKRPSKSPAETQPRASPLGAQPMPLSGTRPLRTEQQRPQSMGSMQGPTYDGRSYSGPPTPAAPVGRNRLQKRGSQVPQSSPLSSISSYHDNNLAPNLPRAHTVDFAGENNYAARYENSHHHRGNSGGSFHGPPIPAKVPMSYNGAPAQENAWALLEEMKNIDLGSTGGRTRRKGHLVV